MQSTIFITHVVMESNEKVASSKNLLAYAHRMYIHPSHVLKRIQNPEAFRERS